MAQGSVFTRAVRAHKSQVIREGSHCYALSISQGVRVGDRSGQDVILVCSLGGSQPILHPLFLLGAHNADMGSPSPGQDEMHTMGPLVPGKYDPGCHQMLQSDSRGSVGILPRRTGDTSPSPAPIAVCANIHRTCRQPGHPLLTEICTRNCVLLSLSVTQNCKWACSLSSVSTC